MGENIFTAFMTVVALFSACCLDSDQWQRFLLIMVISTGWVIIWLLRHGYLYVD